MSPFRPPPILFARSAPGCECTSGDSAFRSCAASTCVVPACNVRSVLFGRASRGPIRQTTSSSSPSTSLSFASKFSPRRCEFSAQGSHLPRASPPAWRLSRNSSNDSFSSNTSSSNSGGACCLCCPSLRIPALASKYSTRLTGSRNARNASFSLRGTLQREFALRNRWCATKLSGCSFQLAGEIAARVLPESMVNLRGRPKNAK